MASTATIDEPLTASRQPGARVLLFAVGDQVYGSDIAVVREIIPLRHATRLPGAAPFVTGLINLRGTIVTVLDLGRRLERAAATRGDGSVVLCEIGAKVVGIAVDEVMDVRPLAADGIEAASADDARGGIVRGMARLDGERVVVLLDLVALARQALL